MTLTVPVIAGSWPWEAFLRHHYLGPDTESGYSPTYRRRYRLSWVQASTDLLANSPRGLHFTRRGRRLVATPGGERPFGPPSPSFESALDEIVDCEPDLRTYRDDLFPWERTETEKGVVISFFLNRLLPDRSRVLHLSSFVFRDAQGCARPGLRPEAVDIDYGGPERRVWDVLSVNGETFIVVACHQYEEQAFELFRRHGTRLERVLAFSFATLG